MIYMDSASTTAVSGGVLETMIPYFTDMYGNPSSTHGIGRQVREAVDTARKKIAVAINALPEEIFFTSGGTESDNWAIKGTAFAAGKGHIITSAIEHPAVLEPCKWMKDHGFSLSVLPVNEGGEVDPEELRKAIRPDTILISVMTANNEIGTIQPIREIGQIAKEKGIIFHTDAVQAVGAIKIDVQELGVDLLSISGHKFHAPKGIGALYIRKGTKIDRLMHGGGQERTMRSGTENVPGIVGLGEAIEAACRDMEKNRARLDELRWTLLHGLDEAGAKYRINGSWKRLPNNINLTIEGAGVMAPQLDYLGYAVSSGSACSGGKPSRVLKAIGLSSKEIEQSVRITLSPDTTAEDVAGLVGAIERLVG